MSPHRISACPIHPTLATGANCPHFDTRKAAHVEHLQATCDNENKKNILHPFGFGEKRATLHYQIRSQNYKPLILDLTWPVFARNVILPISGDRP
uniref:Uncharacterized protein n=1 Tax=mine drainage metagenome TaxID=410659 RepID=E6Q0F3_9ZZZZ